MHFDFDALLDWLYLSAHVVDAYLVKLAFVLPAVVAAVVVYPVIVA